MSSLKLAPLPSHASECTPQLMPFHIAYSGPAPISTYFRVKTAPEPAFGRDPPAQLPLTNDFQGSIDSQETLVAEPFPDVDTKVDLEKQASGSAHFLASFRGRAMHGTQVALPPGYSGVVLRSLDDEEGKRADTKKRREEEARDKAKGRSTRRSKRVQQVEDEDDAMDASNASDMGEEAPVRVLQPTSTFSSFVLWHPDNPVDEGRDEYFRSLKEWTALAAEIHRVEE